MQRRLHPLLAEVISMERIEVVSARHILDNIPMQHELIT
jgi:hypothetical protein